MINVAQRTLSVVLQKYRNMKFRSKLILLSSVSIVVPILLLGIFILSYFQSSMINYEENALEQNMHQLKNMIDYCFETYMNKSDMVYNNIEFHGILTKKNKTLSEKLEDSKAITNIMNPVVNETQHSEFKNSSFLGGNIRLEVYVYETEQPLGNILFSPNTIGDEVWYDQLMNGSAKFVWTHYLSYKGQHVIALSRRLVDLNSGKQLGVFRIYLPVEKIEKIMKNAMGNSSFSFLYLDDEGQPVALYGSGIASHGDTLMNIEIPDPGTVRRVPVEKENYLVGSMVSGINGYRLVYFAPVGTIDQKTSVIVITIMVVLFGAIGLCVLTTTTLSFRLTRRINVLIEQTSHVETGNLTVTRRITENDELGRLDERFCQMARRLEEFIQREYISQITIDRVKYELLQEQINPHLLYNTLAFLSYSAKKAEKQELVELADKLIFLYRAVLHHGKITTTFGDELNVVKTYLAIVSIVYELDINVVYDVDESILSCYTLKLLLQPIVENAVIHGIRPNKCGALSIRCKSCGNEIILTVEDDGIGMKADTVNDILRSIHGEGPPKGYGLSNVIRRIRLFFGNKYDFSIRSSPWNGSVISIHVPVMNEEQISGLMKDMKINEQGENRECL